MFVVQGEEILMHLHKMLKTQLQHGTVTNNYRCLHTVVIRLQ